MSTEPSIERKKTVLVIEDHEGTSKDLRSVLEGGGYYVESCLNFHDAADYIDSLKPEVSKDICAVIFDYQLDQNGHLNSIPLVRMMKRIPNFSGIMLANSSDEYYNGLLMEAGCTHMRDEGYRKEQGAAYLLRILNGLK